MLDVGILAFAEPIVEHSHWNLLVVGPGLESAILYLLLDRLLICNTLSQGQKGFRGDEIMLTSELNPHKTIASNTIASKTIASKEIASKTVASKTVAPLATHAPHASHAPHA